MSGAWVGLVGVVIGGGITDAGQWVAPLLAARDRRRQRDETRRDDGLELVGKARVLPHEAEPQRVTINLGEHSRAELIALNERWPSPTSRSASMA